MNHYPTDSPAVQTAHVVAGLTRFQQDLLEIELEAGEFCGAGPARNAALLLLAEIHGKLPVDADDEVPERASLLLTSALLFCTGRPGRERIDTMRLRFRCSLGLQEG